MNSSNIVTKNCYNLANYLIKIAPSFIDKNIQINIKENILIINTTKEALLNLLLFLKNNQFLQFKTLVSITAVDYPKKKNRFEINYFLLSYKLNTRIIIKLETNDTTPVPSITSIYKGAN